MNTKKMIRVALVGNPNCGKTTLFNALTGSRQRVGNWAGVTVEKKVGKLCLGSLTIKITDLPGIYSLTVADQNGSLDERIACRYLLEKRVDLIINIVDASNLKRHLYLTRQLLEMQVPCIVALNMVDVATKQQIDINCEQLSNKLGCPVIPMSCRKKQGVNALKTAISIYSQSTISPQITRPQWSDPINQAINELLAYFTQHPPALPASQYRWLAIRLLEKDALAQQLISQPNVIIHTQQCIQKLEQQLAEDSDILFADCRYQWIEQSIKQCQQRRPHKPLLNEKIDQIITHPILGIPIFLTIIYLMFEFSMSVGTLLQPLFDMGSAVLFVDAVNDLGYHLHLPALITAIAANGIGLGINTVLSFTPQIALLFLMLSFLEDCGYMARAAFVMDRVMQAVGLPGKSFIPLLIGFGCNVPAIMATRTLDSHRDRIMTAMMAPFMSCGARLAIFIVFGATFFPHHAGLMIFLLYVIGILVALLTGLILKLTLLRGQSAPFVLEIPHYHLPTFKNLLIHTWQRLKGFVIRAGKVIVPICVLVGSLNTIQLDGSINSQGSSHSLLAVVGRSMTPIFAPMGIQTQNWPATVGLLTGTLAKEVVVGTLNTLYTQNSTTSNPTPTDFHLWRGLLIAWQTTIAGFTQIFSAQMLNPFTTTVADHNMTKSAIGNMAAAFGSSWAAISYLLFVLLYVPCVSTMGAITREIGQGWAWLSTLWSITIAYTVAVCCYQLSQWTSQPLTATAWILAMIIMQGIIMISLSLNAKYTNTKSSVHAIS